MAEKVRCLNPVGYQEPVEMFPLAKRLDTIKGKTIVFSIGAGGEQGITLELRKRLPHDYPDTNWIIQNAAPHATKAGSIALSEEQMKTTDALIRGVIW
jgi:hypothetical protein